jgi:inosine-uridine nucleoside N-ribohydrolase
MVAELYDVATAMVAVDSGLASSVESGLVKIELNGDLTTGQTAIGLDMQSKLAMIASTEELNTLVTQLFTDPEFDESDFMAALFEILMREPDNAEVVLDVKHRSMHRLFMQYLTD